MLRIDRSKGTRGLRIAVMAICLSLPLGCGAPDESHLLSAARDLVARLGGDLAGGGAETKPDGPSRGVEDPGRADASRDPAQAGGAVIIEGGEASEVADAPDDSPESAMYSYIDANGGAHMVRGLQHVPAPYRGRARNLSEGGGPVINRYESKAVPVRRRVIAAAQPAYNPNRSSVVLYGAEWCGACKKAKRLLDEEGVSYELLDIDLDPGAKDEVRDILGSVRIPLLDIDGTYVSGYQPKEIKRLLRRG